MWKEKVLETFWHRVVCELLLFHFFSEMRWDSRAGKTGERNIISLSGKDDFLATDEKELLPREVGDSAAKGNKTWADVEITSECKSERFWYSTKWKDPFQTDPTDLLNL